MKRSKASREQWPNVRISLSEDGWYIRVKNTHGPVEEGIGREGKVHLHSRLSGGRNALMSPLQEFTGQN